MRGRAIWLAALAVLPVAAFAVRAVALGVYEFANPCVGWSGVPPGGSCRQLSVTSESKTQAAIRLAAVPGTILFAAGLGIWAAARSRGLITLAAGCLMWLESVPLGFTVWPLSVLAGGALLWVGVRELQKKPLPVTQDNGRRL